MQEILVKQQGIKTFTTSVQFFQRRLQEKFIRCVFLLLFPLLFLYFLCFRNPWWCLDIFIYFCCIYIMLLFANEDGRRCSSRGSLALGTPCRLLRPRLARPTPNAPVARATPSQQAAARIWRATLSYDDYHLLTRLTRFILLVVWYLHLNV